MADIIISCTNKKATTVYAAYNAQNLSHKPKVWTYLTLREFYVFLGILITADVNNYNTNHVDEMWKTSSYPLYRAAMGRCKFKSILRFIRFDDTNTREERAKENKAAPIRDLWTMPNSNLLLMFKPSENLKNEQLFSFRGKAKFTQYIPSKPAKYSIKFWWICDAENKAYKVSFIVVNQVILEKPIPDNC